MEAKTRVKRAITYLNGALGYLDSPTNEWSIKQAQLYVKNAKTLLLKMKLSKSDIQELTDKEINALIESKLEREYYEHPD